MARKPDGPPPEPAVQRLRLCYAKRGRMRFASHRDFQRALERAVRRAGLPVAFSGGFTPHPRISYANAAPTGAASEAEYLEISLTRVCDPAWVCSILNDALPPGLDVIDAVPSGGGALADRLEASVWRIELPGVGADEARAALARFLAAARVEVQRMTKSGIRTFDARAAVLSAEVTSGEPPAGADVTPSAPSPAALPGEPGVDPDGHAELSRTGDSRPDLVTQRVAQAGPLPCAILQLVVRHTTPAVRPDDVLAALRSQADLAPPSPPRMTRLAQGPLDGESGSVVDPLTADRDFAGA